MSGREGVALTRRELLLKAGAAAGGVAALGVLPSGAAAEAAARGAFTGTLHVLGLDLGLNDLIKQQAEKDLGFTVVFDSTNSDTLVAKATTEPASFDVLDYYYYVYDVIWQAGSLQPIDTRRITRWRQVNSLFKYGKVRPGDPHCTYGQGDAAFRCMYLDDSGRYPVSADITPGVTGIVQWIDERTGKPYRGLPAPRYVNGVPVTFNLDAIGYNARVIDRPPEKVSWAELFNPRWKGRVALFDGSQIGLLDAGNAAEAAGLMRFRDKGDMTRGEIDRLVKILIKLKKGGQFRGFWNETTLKKATEFMLSGEVVVESMWAPQVTALQAKGFPARYAAPPQGYRGWSEGLAISSAIEDPARLQAAYDYINWWHAGYGGALTMRVGYYNAVQATSRRFVDPAEWGYWIAGKPAAKDLLDPFGDVTIRKGQVRDGGSFARRACKYACWNSLFREHVYQERRWRDFRTG
jgi:putative spermidine/putrescine transport system substrate-binding protein